MATKRAGDLGEADARFRQLIAREAEPDPRLLANAANVRLAVDGRTLVFSAGLALATALAFGTVPALATVGLTEHQAKEQDLDVEVRTSDMTDWLSAKTYAETVAYAKVLVSRTDDTIVGAHLVGHHGEDLIHLFAMAMRHGITATQMKSAVYGFPTFASDLKNVV